MPSVKYQSQCEVSVSVMKYQSQYEVSVSVLPSTDRGWLSLLVEMQKPKQLGLGSVSDARPGTLGTSPRR